MNNKLLYLLPKSILFIGFYPIVPNSLKGLIFLPLLILSTIFFAKNQNTKINTKEFIINSSLFVSYLISFLYTSNIYQTIKASGPAAYSIVQALIFMVFLHNYKYDKFIIYKLLNTFTVSSLLYIIIYLLSLPADGSFSNVETFNLARDHNSDLSYIGSHPIYTSLFITISIFNSIRLILQYINSKQYKKTIAPVVSMSAFLIFLLSMGVKSALMFSSIAIFFTLLAFYNKSIKSIILLSLLIATITSTIILISPPATERFKELWNSNTYTVQSIDTNNSSQMRVLIWKSAIELIKEKPILGYSHAETTNVLNEKFAENRLPETAFENLNTHNQYLGILLALGLVGFIPFIYFLYFNIQLSLKKQNIIGFAILTVFILNFFTENIIERHPGAQLFFFLINIFAWINLQTHKTTQKNL